MTASGELLGSAYEWQAESRREVGGGARSYAPRFVGTFIHDGGTSGEFHVRHKDSELLTLGVLGAPHSVSGFKTDPASVDCAVEVTGIPDLSLRLEHAFMYSPALLDEADIRAAGDRRFYVGHCFDHGADFAVTHPPAIAVLTALLLADTLLLREYYLRQAD